MPAKRPPIPLSRERIIEAALHIADGQGLRRLTMRRLGDALQVEAMAIYHHIPGGKEALLDALAEHVTTVTVEDGAGGSWQDLARAWARACRAALLAHPGVLALAMTRPPRGRAAAALREHIDRLGDAGLPDPPGALRTIRAYVMGSVAIEVQRSGWNGEAAESADEAVAAFERGLDAVIAGLAAGLPPGAGGRT